MRILVCEDDLDAAGSYKAALESSGHDVLVTFDGQEFLKQTTEMPYDLIILDYKIAKLDGLELAKIVLKPKPQQRIIFASAFVKEALSPQPAW